MYYFTADTHFAHKNIIEYSQRPFENVIDMDDTIIRNWNSVIKHNDIVYHLGDFAFNNPTYYLKKLYGIIHILPGSHDKNLSKVELPIVILTPEGLKDGYGNEQKIILCHYSMRSWPLSHYASWHLYGHCLDSETEILTEVGWKNKDTILESDKVVTLNLDTRLLEYNSIEQIIKYKHTGETIEIKSKGLDLNLTPNHVLIGSKPYLNNQYYKFYVEDFDQIIKRQLIKAGYLPSNGIDFSDNIIRLMVWIAADGSLCNSNLIRIQLFKERKIKRLEELLNQLDISYRKYPTKNGGYYINFSRPPILSDIVLKPLPDILVNCNWIQTNILLDEYSVTDGRKYGKSTMMIWTSKKEEADLIQRICILNGHQCNISSRSGHGFSKKVNYALTITNKQYRSIANTKKSVKRTFVSEKDYWCLKVKNQTLLVRRNGKPVIVGNSHGKLESYGLSFDVGMDTNNFYPYSLDEIQEKMSKLKPIVDYRKG